LKQVTPGQSYTFEVRKGYTWGPGGVGTSALGTPAKVVLRVIANVTTRANLLLTGQLNMGSVVGDDRQRLEARGLKRVDMPISGNWLWINQRSNRPTADKRVRQALVQALDLAEVTKVSTGGYGAPATGMVSMKPNPCPGNNTAGQLPGHDLVNAANLLDQAGWIKGSDGLRRKGGKKLTIDVHYVSSVSQYNKSMAELLDARWRALGITVKLVSDTFLTATKSVFDLANFDIYTTGFGFNDPSQAMRYVDGPTPPKGSNLTDIGNKDYEALANKALTMTLPAACAYWNQAEKALYRDLNLVPISDRPVTFYLNKAAAQNTGQYVPVIPTSLRVFK
jgi:peptide/nickel transport system substrate-binding protein